MVHNAIFWVVVPGLGIGAHHIPTRKDQCFPSSVCDVKYSASATGLAGWLAGWLGRRDDAVTGRRPLCKYELEGLDIWQSCAGVQGYRGTTEVKGRGSRPRPLEGDGEVRIAQTPRISIIPCGQAGLVPESSSLFWQCC